MFRLFRDFDETKFRRKKKVFDISVFREKNQRGKEKWNFFETQFELIKPVLPQAAQLGSAKLSHHLIEPPWISDTLLFINMESQKVKERRRKKPSTRWDSNPQPLDHETRYNNSQQRGT